MRDNIFVILLVWASLQCLVCERENTTKMNAVSTESVWVSPQVHSPPTNNFMVITTCLSVLIPLENSAPHRKSGIHHLIPTPERLLGEHGLGLQPGGTGEPLKNTTQVAAESTKHKTVETAKEHMFFYNQRDAVLKGHQDNLFIRLSEMKSTQGGGQVWLFTVWGRESGTNQLSHC